MPRRREVPKRDILPDPKFGTSMSWKRFTTIMMSGKKSVAERIVYGAFDQIVAKGGKDPIEVFTLAMNNVKPLVEVKTPRREQPTITFLSRFVRAVMALAMRWVRESARKRSENRCGTTPGGRAARSGRKPRRRRQEARMFTAWPTPTRRLRTSASNHRSSRRSLAATIVLY